MPVAQTSQTRFNQGEWGSYMEGRSDLDAYTSACRSLENMLVLPQGGISKRRGFRFIHDLDDIPSTETRLLVFDFNREEQYLLVLSEELITILVDGTSIATVVTPYLGSELANIKTVQSGNTMILVHPDYAPRSLVRGQENTVWTFGEIAFTNLPFFRFNINQTITPSATSGNDITFTVSGSEPYWNAGHVGIELSFNSGLAVLDGLQQNATGGTALSSAGTAANAFDTNINTDTDAGVDGWIGYAFAAATEVVVVGIASATTTTYDLVFETDDNSTFTSPTEVYSATVNGVADTVLWLDIPRHTAETRFRIRETGGAALSIATLVFNRGLVATGDVTDNFTDTTAISFWGEQFWGEHHGYPRTAAFLGNRLVFGGTRDEGASLAFSNDGDVFNFDDTDVNANNAFIRTMSTDQNHIIRNILAQRDGLVIFTSDGEFSLDGGGAPITPTNAIIKPQGEIGSSRVDVLRADGDLIYISSDEKEVLRYGFNLDRDSYVSNSLTTLAHHLFEFGTEPVGADIIRAYDDTQSNLLFFPRTDGEMAVLTLDDRRSVLAWSRWVTEGFIRQAVAVESDLDATGDKKPVLYMIVEREIDSVTKTFVEAFSDEDVYLDHWYRGSDDPPKTNWSGVTTLPNTEVQVVGDNLDQGLLTVEADGDLVTPNAVSQIYVGLPYTATAETMKLKVELRSGVAKGRIMAIKEATVDLIDTYALIINNIPLRFRALDSTLLDQPLVAFTGQRRVKISNRGGLSRDPTVLIEMPDPFSSTVLTLTTKVKVADR